MTTIYVFADSHGYIDNMVHVLRNGMPDMCIFLGDMVLDFESVKEKFPGMDTVVIRGNNDKFSSDWSSRFITVEDRKIFCTHGHEQNVSIEPDLRTLIDAAWEEEADTVLFAHTHIPYNERHYGLDILNPGPIGNNAEHPSYGVLEISGNKIKTSIKYL